jgi:hypothetical protein
MPWALLLFWTGLILTADLVYAVNTWRQHEAVGFAQTDGKIAQSALGEGALGRRGLRLRYTYSVQGVNYTGFRYRYDDANVSLRYAKVVDEYQAHTRHPVYYDPNNPRDSALAPGVDGCDLLLLLVAMPFNVATFAVWSAFLSYRRSRPVAAATGVKILRQKEEIRIRLTEMSAAASALYALGVISVVEVSVVVAGWGFDESMRLMGMVWGLTIILAGAAGTWKHISNNSGRYDLRLNYASNTLILPQAAGRKGPVTVPRDKLRGVIVERRLSATPSGRHYSYLPALSLTGAQGESRTVSLITWGWSEARAVAFGEWLGTQLDAEFLGIQSEALPVAAEVKVPV